MLRFSASFLKFLALILALGAASKFAFASQEGKGGVVVNCSGKPPVTLEYYEASLPEWNGSTPKLVSLAGQSADQVTYFLLGRVPKSDLHTELETALHELGSMDSWKAAELKNSDDTDEVYQLPPSCVKKQAAVRQGSTVWIDPKVLQTLAPEQKGILRFHEALYYVAQQFGVETSAKVRSVVRILLQESMPPNALEVVINSMREVRVPSASNSNSDLGGPYEDRTYIVAVKRWFKLDLDNPRWENMGIPGRCLFHLGIVNPGSRFDTSERDHFSFDVGSGANSARVTFSATVSGPDIEIQQLRAGANEKCSWNKYLGVIRTAATNLKEGRVGAVLFRHATWTSPIPVPNTVEDEVLSGSIVATPIDVSVNRDQCRNAWKVSRDGLYLRGRCSISLPLSKVSENISSHIWIARVFIVDGHEVVISPLNQFAGDVPLVTGIDLQVTLQDEDDHFDARWDHLGPYVEEEIRKFNQDQPQEWLYQFIPSDQLLPTDSKHTYARILRYFPSYEECRLMWDEQEGKCEIPMAIAPFLRDVTYAIGKGFEYKTGFAWFGRKKISIRIEPHGVLNESYSYQITAEQRDPRKYEQWGPFPISKWKDAEPWIRKSLKSLTRPLEEITFFHE